MTPQTHTEPMPHTARAMAAITSIYEDGMKDINYGNGGFVGSHPRATNKDGFMAILHPPGCETTDTTLYLPAQQISPAQSRRMEQRFELVNAEWERGRRFRTFWFGAVLAALVGAGIAANLPF